MKKQVDKQKVYPKCGLVLDHDSHLDCSRICETSLQEVRNLVVEAPSVHLGNVSSDDVSEASKLIAKARTIERKLKRRYGFI